MITIGLTTGVTVRRLPDGESACVPGPAMARPEHLLILILIIKIETGCSPLLSNRLP